MAFDLTKWIDDRVGAAVKAGVDEANKELMADLDTRFKSLEDAIGGVSLDVKSVSDNVAADINNVTGSLTTVITNSIGGVGQLITGIPQQILDGVRNLFPHFP